MSLPPGARPRLASKAKVRFDRKSDRYMLLYPEKGLVLNPTAAAIVQLCTGENEVEQIVLQLAAKYQDQPRESIAREVHAFLDALGQRGLLTLEGAAPDGPPTGPSGEEGAPGSGDGS